MSYLASLPRPSSADVKPGTELYERIIRALRGEYQWNNTSDSSSVEKCRTLGHTALKENNSLVADVTEGISPTPYSNCLENLPGTEIPPLTPPIKRPCYVHNAGQTTAMDKPEQGFETADKVLVGNGNATSAIINDGGTTTSMVLSGEQNLTVAGNSQSPTITRPLPINTQATAQSCTLVQKLQKISQIDEMCSTKTKSRSKYKPPYKIERSYKPSSYRILVNNKILLSSSSFTNKESQAN